MVIVVGNKYGDLSSNPGQGFVHFKLRKYFLERNESNNSPSSFGWIVGQTGFFNIGIASINNKEFQPIELR